MPVTLDHLVARSAGLKDNAVLRLESDGDVTTAERGIFGKFLQLFRNTDAPGTRTMERDLLHDVRARYGNAIAEQAFGMVRSGTAASGKPITAGQVRQLDAYVTQLSQQEQRQTASDAALRCAPAAAAFGKIAAKAGVPPETLSVHQKEFYIELLQQRLAYDPGGPVTDKPHVRAQAAETLRYVASLDTAAICQKRGALQSTREAAGELVRLLGTRESGSKELAAAVMRFHTTTLVSAVAANNEQLPSENEISLARETALRQALDELAPREARERFEEAMSPLGTGHATIHADAFKKLFKQAGAPTGSRAVNLEQAVRVLVSSTLTLLGERGGVSDAAEKINTLKTKSDLLAGKALEKEAQVSASSHESPRDGADPESLGEVKRIAQLQQATPNFFATRIQRAWRANRQRVADKFAEKDSKAGPPVDFVYSQYKSNREKAQTPEGQRINKFGMANVHFRDDTTARRHGMPRTMSAYGKEHHSLELGRGSYATVYRAPRDFILRNATAPAVKREVRAKPVDYGDLDCFVPSITIMESAARSETLQIARNAGDNLYDHISSKKLRGRFPLQNFQDISGQLKQLHERGIYHLDIKLENMTIVEGLLGEQPKLHLVDTDGMVKYAPGQRHAFPDAEVMTYRRTRQVRAVDYDQTSGEILYQRGTRVVPDHRADDEYAFLILMLNARSVQADDEISKMLRNSKPPSKAMTKEMESFVTGAIKPSHRQEVMAFLREPWNHVLSIPLHDMVDWEHGRLS
ncbi:serine/threonine-protein kinase [Hyphomicrobium sp. MC1]|uniref:serine/threonine-protein kinase n=1 Tax=Hyphomicrobium sp. (strain MC1) TaxID=717785 RepID=UPI000213EFD6|nr:serine/threonine-protein kinase [Hyphomicrobium sp. MC1]CCB66675.1 protein of unknown function [Hyphomicrobium sp. MC1]